ncbi:MAG: response regulator transcription factor, partial [Pseudohongiellaceae bacterium]
PVRIILVDDHAVVRAGYRLLLENDPDIEVIAELQSGEEANQQYKDLRPDVVVMDLSMPGMGGIEAIRRIKLKHSDARILVFTMHDNSAFLNHALDAGASGYITKNSAPHILVTAVRKIANGERYIEPALEKNISVEQKLGKGSPLAGLSKREFQVFCLVAEGFSASEISENLSLSVKTVANYQTQIKEKLGISSASELIKLAIRQGIVKV